MPPVDRKHTFDNQPIFLFGEKASGYGSEKNIQDYHKIRQQCYDSKKLFEDPEFPANDKSLFHSRAPDRKYEWKRPKDICENPKFFVGGVSRFDVDQGALGDCWLLAAAASLTQDKKLFSRVVYDDNTFDDKYAGVFHFCFWQYGKWIDVVIDDRLPTVDGRLVFMHSKDDNEFWSALLEKAYAKLFHSFEALKGGTTNEALEDFTGGLTEMFKVKEAPKNLFHILKKGFERKSMMGCSIEADQSVTEAKTPQGLIRGHAYSITKTSMVDKVMSGKTDEVPLLRLRNPWGNAAEWNGPWSDDSPEWKLIPEDSKKKIGLTFDDDGEFWMSFADFRKNYDTIEICNLGPEPLSTKLQKGEKKDWYVDMFEGQWTKGITAGGCRNNIESFYRNPQYLITLKDPDEEEGMCTAVIALMQKNRRSKHVNLLSIGFGIYHLTEEDLAKKPLPVEYFKQNLPVAKSASFVNSREVSCRFSLPPGSYLIVPSTFKADEEGEFLIRVYCESKYTLEENDETIGIDEDISKPVDKTSKDNKPPPEKVLMEKLFTSGAEKEIGWAKLKKILDQGMSDAVDSQGFSKDICRSMVAMLDADHSGKLRFEEFQVLVDDVIKWKKIFKTHDRDNSNRLNASELREAFTSAGYHLNNHILSTLVYRYGSDDKSITFDDFILCAVKVKTMIDHFKEKDYDNTKKATFSMDEWVTKALYS